MQSPKPIDQEFIETQLERICKGPGKGACPVCRPCQCWEECVKTVAESVICRQPNWCNPEAQTILNARLESETLVGIDWLLHLGRKRYRDHASHQLFVGTLGSFLLSCKLGSRDGETLKQWIAAKKGWCSDEVDIAWWMASLLHDHAYPLEQMLKVTPALVKQGCRMDLLDHTWSLLGCDSSPDCRSASQNSVVKDLYDPDLLRSLRKNAEIPDPKERRLGLGEILDRWLAPMFGEGTITRETAKVQDGETCYDHGILGAANLAALLLSIEQDNSILNAAIRAIGIHNGPACHETVNAAEDPLAFLLILCDEFQEWDRRIVVNDEVLTESDQIYLRGLDKEGDDYIVGDSLTIVFEYPKTETLERTKWSYTIFSESKKKAFNRLAVPIDFPIKPFQYEVRIPHSVQFHGGVGHGAAE